LYFDGIFISLLSFTALSNGIGHDLCLAEDVYSNNKHQPSKVRIEM